MKLLKRIFIWAGLVLLSLILLCILACGLFIGWMKWSGDRNWKRVQAELHARGEKLTFEELLPPPPPDSQNFYADPIWQELADLVQVTENSGFGEYQAWEPRLPSDKRAINQWLTPLSASEQKQIETFIPQAFSKPDQTQRESFHKLFPTAPQNLNSSPSRSIILWTLSQLLTETTDPLKRRRIAQLQLDLLKPAGPMLARISDLSKRPAAFFPQFYRDISLGTFPELNPLLELSKLYSYRCKAELALGDHAAASTDVLNQLQLSQVERLNPLLIFHLVRRITIGMALASIEIGIEGHQWNDAELAAFQQRLQCIQLISDLCFAFRGERAYYNSWNADSMSPEFFPSKHKVILTMLIHLQAEAVNDTRGDWNESYQRLIDTLEQSGDRGINVESPFFVQDQKYLHSHPIQQWLHHSIGNSESATQGMVETQTQVTQTIIACALERYRLANGACPVSLDALIPVYLSTIPKEPTTGNPMHYRLLPDGSFLLWAPGWKLQTLNGKPGEHFGEGDIVWTKPIPKMLTSTQLRIPADVR